MPRTTFFVVLAFLLFVPGLSATRPQTDQKPAIKAQILEIRLGSPADVPLRSKQKLRGRMGEVFDEGCFVQHLKAGEPETTKLAFDEVNLDVKGSESSRSWEEGRNR